MGEEPGFLRDGTGRGPRHVALKHAYKAGPLVVTDSVPLRRAKQPNLSDLGSGWKGRLLE